MFNFEKNIGGGMEGDVAVSSSEKKEISEEQESIKGILQKQNEIFNKVLEIKDDVEREDLIPFVENTFENSVDDGLLLIKKLRLTPKEIIHSLNRPQFYLKHRRFAEYLYNEIKLKENKINDKDLVEKIINNYDYFKKEIEEGRLEKLLELSDEPISEDDNVNNLISDSNKVYEEFLKSRELELKAEEEKDTFSEGERLAFNNLVKAKRALSESYYSGNILKIVFSKLDDDFVKERAEEIYKNDKEAQEVYESFEKYLKFFKKDRPADIEIIALEGLKNRISDDELDEIRYQNLVSKELVSEIVETFELDDNISEKKLNKALYKPLDLTFKIENADAKKKLVNEINDSLSFRGIKKSVVYNSKLDVYEIIDEEGEDESSKFERKSLKYLKDKYDSVNVGDFIEIAGKLVFIVRKDGKEFIVTEDGKEYGKEYDKVSDPTEVAGKLVFRAEKDGKWFIVTEDGKEYGKEYDDVYDPTEVAGKLVFRPIKDGKRFIVTEDGKEYGKEYNNVYHPTEVAGKLVFKVIDGKSFIVTEDGKEYGKEYGLGRRLILAEVAGKLVFKAEKDGKWFIVTEDGKEYGKEYNNVYHPTEVAGKLVFEAKKVGKWFIATEDGKEYGKEYDYTGNPTEVAGKLVFGAQKDGKLFIVIEDKIISDEYDEILKMISDGNSLTVLFRKDGELGKDVFLFGEQKREKSLEDLFSKYDGIYDPTDVAGKLVFSAEKDGKYFIVTEDGKEYGKDYDVVDNPTEIAGKLVFEAEKDGKYFIVTEDGKEYGKEHDRANNPTDVAGKLVFRAEKDGKQFIATEDGKEYGREYDNVYNPTEVADKLVFRVKKDGKSFIVTEDGKEYGKEYDNAYNPTDVAGKLVFEAGKDGEGFIAIEDGKEYGKKYNNVYNPTDVAGKLVFVAEKDGKSFIATEDGKEYGKEYDNVYDPTEVAGKLVFIARKDGKWFIATENEIISDGYEKIKNIFPNGDYVTAYVVDNGERKRVDIPVSGKEMPEELLEKLDLLNTVNTPTLESIDEVFHDEDEEKTAKEKVKSFIEKSQRVAKGFTDLIKKSPEFFRKTISGKKDKLINFKTKRLIKDMFPEAYKDEDRFSGYFGLEGSFGFDGGGEERGNGLEDEDEKRMEGGSLKEGIDEKGEKEIMELREPINQILSTAMYGDYNNGLWKRVMFYVNEDLGVKTTEKTITLTDLRGVTNSSLPKTLSSKIIKERVKGIKEDGEEVDLTPEINSMGEGKVRVPSDVEKIIYSIEQPDVSPIMDDLDKDNYDKFKSKFLKSGSSRMVEEISELPDEAELFLQEIRDKSPKEQVIEIERFVRGFGYYDFNNGEVTPLKRGKSLEEQFYIMSQRVEELKEKGKNIGDRRFAGVCEDFANLTLAMLRKAGFVSGKVTGFMPSGKKVSTENAHGTAFVVWPDKEGKTKTFVIDGTPTGVDDAQTRKLEESGVSGSSIEEKEEKAEESLNEEKEKAEEDLKEILETIENDDVEEIKKLTNGKLEDTLNVILRYEVKQNHLKVLKNVLDSFWYSPASSMDFDENKEELAKWFDYQIEDERKKITEEDVDLPAGSYLFGTVENFVNKFIKGGLVDDKSQAFDVLDKITDVAGNKLNNIEKRAITVIVTYLRAKKMSK